MAERPDFCSLVIWTLQVEAILRSAGHYRPHPPDYVMKPTTSFIDSIKLVICVGFTPIPLPCTLAFDSRDGDRRS
jgi:hypothetical protein